MISLSNFLATEPVNLPEVATFVLSTSETVSLLYN